MKQLFITFILFTAVSFVTMAGEIELKGTFQGDNLFVKNPFAQSGVGFCVYEVTVNGLTTTDEINSSAFEVDLTVYGFKIGEPLSIAIKYKEDCKPMVLNAEVLKPRSTFEIVSLSVDENSIKWKTTKEAGSLDFDVQQFRWNKWVNVGKVTGKGTSTGGAYSAKVRLHSGRNRFRLKQSDYRGKPRYTKEVAITSKKQAVTFSPTRVDDVITFSDETMYEIYDVYGGIMFKGYGKEVKVNGLAKGKYYLNMDNKLTTFNKK